jgi:hypothetical protein
VKNNKDEKEQRAVTAAINYFLFLILFTFAVNGQTVRRAGNIGFVDAILAEYCTSFSGAEDGKGRRWNTDL